MTPAGMGLIEWVAQGTELRRPFYHYALGTQTTGAFPNAALPSPWADAYAAGDLAQLWLDYGYRRLEHAHDDQRKLSITPSGVTTVRFFATSERWTFGMDNIDDLRGAGLQSDFLAIESFVDVAIRGIEFAWAPDFENHPNEYFMCVLEKRHEPRRLYNRGWWRIDFELRVLPSVQFPSTVPGFV